LAYLFGAVAYVCMAILVMNLLAPIMAGLPKWADIPVFVIQVAPLMWLVGKAIAVKNDG
jgi:hypothetical protein